MRYERGKLIYSEKKNNFSGGEWKILLKFNIELIKLNELLVVL